MLHLAECQTKHGALLCDCRSDHFCARCAVVVSQADYVREHARHDRSELQPPRAH
jgi:hypothetical protein